MTTPSFETIRIADLRAGRYQREETSPDDLRAFPDSFVKIAASNPLARDDDPVGFVFWQKGTPVARVRLLRGQARIGADVVPVFWDMDLLSLASHRSAGAGAFLVKGMLRTLTGLGAHVGSFASTREALGVYEKLKMPTVGIVPRYLWPLRAGPILRTKVSDRAARLASPVLDVLSQGLEPIVHLRSRWQGRDYRFQDRPEFDAQLDRLLADARSHEPYEFPSTAAILNWRLAAIVWSDPAKIVIGRTIHDSKGQLVGYTILRSRHHARIAGHPYRDIRVLSLMDFWVAPGANGAHDAIIADLAREGWRQKVDILEVMTNDRPMTAALTAARFRRVGGNSFSYYSGPQQTVKSELDDWRLTMAIGDGFTS
jgi:hypothetical protein